MDGLGRLALGELPMAEKSRALIMASRKGLTQCIMGLLEAGANANAEDDYAYTPLMYVAAQGMDSCILTMLECTSCKVNKRTDSQQTALHFAAAKGHKDCVQILLEHGALVNAADDWGETPLMQAVGSGSTSTVRLLLDSGARMDMTDLRGDDAFMHAAKNGHKDIIQLLLEHGTNPNKYFKTSALHRAASFGHADCVKLLLEAGADVRMRDNHGYTPMELATQTDQWQVVQCLLDHGEAVQKEELDTALAASAFWDATKSVPILLDHGASPNAVDKHGIPAFFLAIAQNNIDMVVSLIQHNCDVNKPVPRVYFYNTEFEEVCSIQSQLVMPLHLASLRAYSKLVQILIVAGARTEPFYTLLVAGVVPGTITEDPMLMSWLRLQCEDDGPCSLRHLSRTVIRTHIPDNESIRHLFLPPLLQDYLLFEDLNCIIDQS